MHSAKPERSKGKHLLIKKPNVQQESAKFKSDVKHVMTFCCDTEDEDMFKACKSQQNRLKHLAINNKHASIQGMPEMSPGDAMEITDSILKLKGISCKPLWPLQKDGMLKLLPKNFNYKGAFYVNIFSATKVDWPKAPNKFDDRMPRDCKKLEKDYCPDCSTSLNLGK